MVENTDIMETFLVWHDPLTFVSSGSAFQNKYERLEIGATYKVLNYWQGESRLRALPPDPFWQKIQNWEDPHGQKTGIAIGPFYRNW